MEQKTLFSDIFLLTCYIFAPATAILNIILGLTINSTSLLTIGGVFLIFIIAFTFSSFAMVIRGYPYDFMRKNQIVQSSVCFYTCTSSVINLFVHLFALKMDLPIKNLWSIYSIILILTFSVVISICMFFLKSKNAISKLIIYFFVIGIFYFLLTVTIASLAEGNSVFVFIGVYVFAYALASSIYLLISRKKKNKELESKPYQKQF